MFGNHWSFVSNAALTLNFILKLYIFGGRNIESDFNNVMAMKLINPSDRQPSKLLTLIIYGNQ